LVTPSIPQTQSKMYKSAMIYAEKFKWSVFPIHTIKNGVCTCYKGTSCEETGKHPKFDKELIPNGCTNATKDRNTIHKWWSKWVDANIGIATGKGSGFFVLDVDPRDGGDDSLQELIDKYGELPETVEAITGSGGRHILFTYPDQNVKNSAGLIGEGLDIRGNGGYIVVAPSLHESGGSYEWELSSHPSETEIKAAPGWLLHMVAEKENEGKHEKVPSNYWHEVMQGVSEPGRNATATKILGHLLRRYIDPYMAWNIIEMWNERNDPPLSQKELHTTFNSIMRKELRERERRCNV
jgi:hypothetical protein